ncbi:MAG TPA: hypothetical protein VGI39_44165 [Polyangiaceae bacterium]|jgi:hypothetical protein
MKPSLPARSASLLGAAALLVASSALAAKPKRPRPAPHPPPAAAPAAEATTPAAAVPASGPIDITVVERAGSRAYVKPGATSGLVRGSTVQLRGKTYPVVESSDSFAVIDVGDDRVREQETGRATRAPGDADKAAELPKPHALAAWEHAWTPAAPPADAQHPAFVPLGEDTRNRRFDVQLTLLAGGNIPLGSRQIGTAIAMGELNARIHAEPFAAPFKLDVDASLRGWAAADLASRVGGPTRSAVFVREFWASYTGAGLSAGFGRMRYASSTLGTLDGLRASADLGSGFTLGAFGGALPNPMTGDVSLDAQRFGVEARYSRPDLSWRPEAALVAHGSMFQGSPDERRLSGVFAMYPGDSRLGAYFELSNFDANNPWNEPGIALTAAGIDPSVRIGPVTLGARLDVREPEISNWMASFLPTSWFCRTVPASGANPNAPEPCDGPPSLRAMGELDASLQVGNFSILLGGTTVRELRLSNEADMTGGFGTARLLRLARIFRLEASGNYSTGTYMDLFGGTAGPGVTLLGDALDLSAYYRLSVLKYRAVDTSLTQNGGGATLALIPNASWLFTVQGEATTGDDVSALMLFGTVTWRPRFR